MTKHHPSGSEPSEQDLPTPILPDSEKEEAVSDHHDDVADFANNARTLWQKFGMNFVLVILLAVLTVMIVRWFTGREERALEQAYSELSQSTDPMGKQEVASKYESLPQFAAAAYLESADLRLREAIFGAAPKSGLTEPKQPTADERQKLLKDAAGDYQQVLDRPDRSTLQATAAHFGLAAVLENQLLFDKAAEHYRAVVKLADKDYPSVSAQASRMLLNLNQVSTPVVFPLPPTTAAPIKPSDISPFSNFPTIPDQPKAETPAPEAPKTDAPKTDAPKTPAPVAPTTAPAK